jgi:hypothetical protein
MRRLLVLALVLAACLGAPRTSARGASVVEWLDAYRAGQFDRVVADLERETNFKPILDQLKRDGPGWIAAAGPAEVQRRELVATTFALEAARIGMRYEWKRIQMQERFSAPGGPDIQPLNVLYWNSPPLLIEWGCELFRKDATPRPIERWWQLAALAVAQRAEDTQFLVGDPKIGAAKTDRDAGVVAGEIGNIADEIKHLEHVWKRFPEEKRFVLGQGIARDREWHEDAVQAYRALENDPIVGGEALMRLGAMYMRLRKIPEALKALDKAQSVTRDPYVVFLASYFSGQIYERQPNLDLAEKYYRTAAAAVPNAQSATLALASILARDERRAEAQRLVREMLEAEPAPVDPWRRFVQADDRFWPLLIRKLRIEIAR